MWLERDPEEVGPEHPDDLELRMSVQESIHTYDPGPDGKCQAWVHTSMSRVGRVCGSTQRSSVLHDDPDSEFRQMHDHGGGDCMCFENEDGPSYYDALKAYREARRR
jgi:hypothetical protein